MKLIAKCGIEASPENIRKGEEFRVINVMFLPSGDFMFLKPTDSAYDRIKVNIKLLPFFKEVDDN